MNEWMNEWMNESAFIFLDGRNGMEDKPQKLHALPSSYLIYNFQST